MAIHNILSIAEHNIKAIQAEMLLETAVFDELEEMPPAEALKARMELERIAGEIRCKTEFSRFMKLCEKAKKKEIARQAGLRVIEGGSPINLKTADDGTILDIINNYIAIMESEKVFAGVRLNELGECPEVDGHRLTDGDFSRLFAFIQDKYALRNEKNFSHALNVFLSGRTYNPVKEIIEAARWDGRERLEMFLPEWLNCEDSAYAREVSRLIFAGGINRLYNAGCKFDTVPVFVGEQGTGKSTVCHWLALDDKYFNEVSTFEGREGIEALQGVFIAEIGELFALTKMKEQEGIKAFITRQNDRMRLSYGRFVKDLPRRCIFIGTTNNPNFLRDLTGNRRWLPIKINADARMLYKYEKQCKEYILQCWAEALEKFRAGDLPTVAGAELAEVILGAQKNAMEDDYRLGMTEEFLNRVYDKQTCIIEIWEKALREYGKPRRKDCNDIAGMLRALGWKRDEKASRYGEYGVQYLWRPSKDKLPF
ncbi:MAG: VapE domain-containing protein [Bacillota bacterium]|jgi:predicted P-loop ATPase